MLEPAHDIHFQQGNFLLGVAAKYIAHSDSDIYKLQLKTLINCLVLNDGTIAKRPSFILHYILGGFEDKIAEMKISMNTFRTVLDDINIDNQSGIDKSENFKISSEAGSVILRKTETDNSNGVLIPFYGGDHTPDFITFHFNKNKTDIYILTSENNKKVISTSKYFDRIELGKIGYTQTNNTLFVYSGYGSKIFCLSRKETVESSGEFKNKITFKVNMLDLSAKKISLPITSMLFFQKRIWIGGSHGAPTTIYASSVNNLDDFNTDINSTGFSNYIELKRNTYDLNKARELKRYYTDIEDRIKVLKEKIEVADKATKEHHNNQGDKALASLVGLGILGYKTNPTEAISKAFDASLKYSLKMKLLTTELDRARRKKPSEDLDIEIEKIDKKIKESGEKGPISFNLLVDKVPHIQWLYEWQNSILIGTTCKLLVLTGKQNQPQLSGGNIQLKHINPLGVNHIKPIEVDKTIIVFVSSDNKRLLELSGTVSESNIRDLTTYCSYFLDKVYIKQIAIQNLPFKIIWILGSDNKLYSLTYDKTMNTMGWAQHQIDNCKIVSLTNALYQGFSTIFLLTERNKIVSIERLDDIYKIHKKIREKSMIENSFYDFKCMPNDISIISSEDKLAQEFIEKTKIEVLKLERSDDSYETDDEVYLSDYRGMKIDRIDRSAIGGFKYDTKIETFPITIPPEKYGNLGVRDLTLKAIKITFYNSYVSQTTFRIELKDNENNLSYELDFPEKFKDLNMDLSKNMSYNGVIIFQIDKSRLIAPYLSITNTSNLPLTIVNIDYHIIVNNNS